MSTPKYMKGDLLFVGRDQVRVMSADLWPLYACMMLGAELPITVPEEALTIKPRADLFHAGLPSILVVDDFYIDPDLIRKIGLAHHFYPEPDTYKGKRTRERFLPMFLKEAFEKLLNVKVTDWLGQRMNGVFQLSNKDDPLVWHADTQTYAAAVYLTPDAPIDTGTSFWRSREPETLHRRKPHSNALYNAKMFSEHNLMHVDNWELVDRVGSVYNRLVLWDAQLIHSATSYQIGDNERLVQLFFFNARPAGD